MQLRHSCCFLHGNADWYRRGFGRVCVGGGGEGMREALGWRGMIITALRESSSTPRYTDTQL